MNKWLRLSFAALALLLVFFSAPHWLPGAVASVAGAVEARPANLSPGTEPILIWDTGWLIGNTTQRVLAVPQVIAWSPAQEEPLWATETGFSFGGFYDAAGGRIFLIEQRSSTSKSLLDMTISWESHYPPSGAWPVYLTVLNSKTGQEISRTILESDFVYSANGGIGRPVAVIDSSLYIMKYGSLNNLVVYDLAQQTFLEARLNLCDTGYPSYVHYVENMDAFVTLCMDYTTGMETSLVLTSRISGEQQALEMTLLGEEDYMSGNGLLLGADDRAYVIDSDARSIAEIDLVRMTLLRIVNYAEGPPAAESSLADRIVAWLLDQSAGTAYAKRWSALTSISPDGRWLAVDGGMGLSNGVSHDVFIIDMQTLQAVQQLDLGSSNNPTSLTFGEDSLLYVFLEKQSHRVPVRVLAFDLANGAQSEFAVTMSSPAYEILNTK